MDMQGYCTIKKNATTCKGTDSPNKFLGKDCQVMEFDQWGGALVLASDGSGLAMFDKEDIIRRFECGAQGEYLTPPNLHPLEQMAYVTKLMSRKGGYNHIIRGMVIQYGLMKGKYNDDFLFQVEREESFKRSKMTKKDIKIMELQDLLTKHKESSYKRRGNPRRLRRLLRRLKNKKTF